jgi:hypothetical protein
MEVQIWKETETRRNIVIDIRKVGVPQFTVEIWAVELKQSNLDAVLSEFRTHKILICEHITRTTPEFVVVVWTLSAEAWQRAFATLSYLPTD